MSPPTELQPETPEPDLPDVVDVIDRVALIENVINQVIVGYCKPQKEAWEFMWSVVLDTSVMALGAKLKVVLAISHEIGHKLDKDSLHQVIALRNAFAHHASNAHPVYAVGRTPEQDTTYLQLWVLEGSGKISRLKRDEAFAKFNKAYRKALESLVQLKNLVAERYERSGA